MAAYFHGNGSEMQSSADGLQTLYLMNPTYVPYNDATSSNHPTPNMLLINPNATTSHALTLPNLPHAPPLSNQHLIHGVTNILGSTTDDHHHTRPSIFGHHDGTAFHGFSPGVAPRMQYNLWGQAVDQPSPSATTPGSLGRRPSQQGLSLSLSSQQTPYRSVSGEVDVTVPGIGNSASPAASNGVIMGSKYLRAVQELLDEVVNVGKGIYKEEKEKMKGNRESNNNNASNGGESGGGENSNNGGKQVVELSTAQRQELQMKKSKLVTMLDEVEQRYRQYHQQMQIVIQSFEEAAGFGASKCYTALALKTISKQFRCLKDAISGQIRATSKTLGEDDCLGVKVEGSRLRYVDHHLRQQRALQQLGMIQPNAWRPQRGLPERAVSILRAWLFEHFLHPYPKDSDKVMLAKQTGLARSQVSNWFINARVRLWKPMVEEMYLEEVKEQEKVNASDNNNNNILSKDQSTKELGPTPNLTQDSSSGIAINNQIKAFQLKQESFNNGTNTSQTEISTNSSLSPMGGGGSFQSHSDIEMKHLDHTFREANGGGYGAFSMEDIGSRFNVTEHHLASRFHGNGGVSLTLGLPHNENLQGTQHGFLSQNVHLGRRLEMGTNNGSEFCAINTTTPSSGNGYENIEIQNRKRFVAQLLPDFVT